MTTMTTNQQVEQGMPDHEKIHRANEDLVRRMSRLKVVLGKTEKNEGELENALEDVGHAIWLSRALVGRQQPDTTFDERRSHGPRDQDGLGGLFGDWTSDVWDWVRHLQENRAAPISGFPRMFETFEALADDCKMSETEPLYWNSTASTRQEAHAWTWVLALSRHGKQAWGDDYSVTKVKETFEELLRARLLLKRSEYHRVIYANPVLDVAERYAWEIRAFFDGRDDDAQANDSERGHVWIRRGERHQSLVVEPPTGHQFTVAVRFPNPEEPGSYHGYRASPDGLQGIELEH